MRKLEITKQVEADEKEEKLEQVSQVVSQVDTQKEAVSIGELPKSKLYSRLKKLNSFKEIKKNYKLNSQKDIFVSDIKALLQHLSVSEHEYDIELLVEVMNACEEFFIYGNKKEREQCKVEAIFELMLPFFKSEQVLEKFVGTVSGKVKKSNFLRRMFRKMVNFFL